MTNRRPNVLVLMTDQQRFDTIAAAGYPHMITPNLDRLVREGCLFRNAFTPNPICMPARHHLLTGLTARRHGFWDNGTTPPDWRIPTLPLLLSNAGYETRAIGKMHFQPPRRHHGFDRMELMEEHPRYREADDYALYLQSVGLGHIQNLHGIRNILYEAAQRSLVPDEHHGSTWVADRTIAFLEANAGRQPFFCWSGWIAPHPPFNLPSAVAGLYRNRVLPEPLRDTTEPNEFTRVMTHNMAFPPPGVDRTAFLRRRQEAYYAQITYVDLQIGRVLDALERTGLLDDTLIIFTSDHGEMLGDHASIQKSQPYDSATRIPLIMRFPSRLAPGTAREEFTDLNDILPTVLDVAGVDYPDPNELPGASVFRDAKDRSVQYCSLGIRGRRWATLRDRKYKYTYYYSLDRHELFDMEADPGESTNLLATRPGDPAIAAARDRLHRQVMDFEKRWGPADCVDEQGQLRRYPPLRHGTLQELYDSRAREFPTFPSRIANPVQRAAMNSFAEEALQAIRDEPLSRLHPFDLGAWREHGATKDFLERVRCDKL